MSSSLDRTAAICTVGAIERWSHDRHDARAATTASHTSHGRAAPALLALGADRPRRAPRPTPALDATDARTPHPARSPHAVPARYNSRPMHERLGIVGSGAIACGLAAAAARHGEVVLWARSDGSAQRARATVDKNCGRLSGEVNAEHVKIVQDLGALSDATAIVEAVVEDVGAKAALWRELAQVADDQALLGSTTSSLSVAELAGASGAPERFVGLHVFNPVPKMKLVELAFPAEASAQTRARATALCEGARQDRGDRARHPGLRRQPPALPLPLLRGRAAGGDRPGGGVDRHLHAARRRPPDGPARAAGLRRPRRRPGDRRGDRRRRPGLADGARRRGRAGPQERPRLLRLRLRRRAP